MLRDVDNQRVANRDATFRDAVSEDANLSTSAKPSYVKCVCEL
jgi:hypothetical protein